MYDYSFNKIIVFLFFIFNKSSSLPTQHQVLSNQNLKIVGGISASEGEFPWQVALIIDSKAFCGGSLINDQWILTAGHCITSSSKYTAILGVVNYKDSNKITKESETAILHEEYSDEGELANNIGLIQVESIEFTNYIEAIPMADSELGAGVNVIVSGWGSSSDYGPLSDFLQFIELYTISNLECNGIFVDEVLRIEMVCAVYPGNSIRGPCNGDNGGPMIVHDSTNSTLVGVVSFVADSGCESGYPSGYTRVAFYRNWIRGKTGI